MQPSPKLSPAQEGMGMIQSKGASVPDQALVASDQATARLDGPRFDPSRDLPSGCALINKRSCRADVCLGCFSNSAMGKTAYIGKRGRMDDYQAAVARWMIECFGEIIAMDPLERIMRFLEEALELAQAEGMTSEEAERVLAYVYGRDAGETPQEVGGVMVTLAAFCYRRGVDLQTEALREIDRIDSPEMRRKIFAKQAFKRSQGLTSDGGFRAASAIEARSGETQGGSTEGESAVPKADAQGEQP